MKSITRDMIKIYNIKKIKRTNQNEKDSWVIHLIIMKNWVFII